MGARKALERSDYDVQFAKSQTLPQVDLIASYGGTGVGGTAIRRDPPGSDNIVETIPGGYGDAVSDALGFDFPTWRVGVNFSYAIPNRTAKAASAQAQLGREQAQASYERLVLNAAVEVRTAGRAVETNIKRVASTRAARTLAAQRLDAEEKKFAAGMSTNFLVTQAPAGPRARRGERAPRGGGLPQERHHLRARAGGRPRQRGRRAEHRGRDLVHVRGRQRAAPARRRAPGPPRPERDPVGVYIV